MNSCDDSNSDDCSSDEGALWEILGIPSSMRCLPMDDESAVLDSSNTSVARLPCNLTTIHDLEANITKSHIEETFQKQYPNLKVEYATRSLCTFPHELSISAEMVRKFTDEIVWNVEKYSNVLRTYESIQVWKNGEILERSALTRLEYVCKNHAGWQSLCTGYIQHCISLLLDTPMVLYKDKLNLKPAGGSGFAPHIDTPSLRNIQLSDSETFAGPKTFVTVMIAIDNMTPENGCLRFVPGVWNENSACTTISPTAEGNPDADGRAGEIPNDVASSLMFEDCACTGGTIVAFNGWTPHRSAPNQTPFGRRAMFLTYNPASEGIFYETYYNRMKELRSRFRHRTASNIEKTTSFMHQCSVDPLELHALASIPRI